ncbi:hypothetical protein [Segetibacter koreensis]|nr:hypothetical protein [Segetibacter koreensis]
MGVEAIASCIKMLMNMLGKMVAWRRKANDTHKTTIIPDYEQKA